MSTSSAAVPEVSLTSLSGVNVGISVLTLSRPAARNALSRSMLLGFSAAIATAGARAASRGGEIRALIVTSDVPKVFCAGADLKERAGMSAEEVGDFVRALRVSFSALAALPMPTYAAIEGAALGGGLELALCCDARIAGEAATLGLPEASLAIVPGAGGTARLPRLIGVARAKELIFSARRLTAADAERYGIVNAVVPAGGALAAAVDAARAAAANGPLAIAAVKAAIDAGEGESLATALRLEEDAYAKILPTTDRLEGLAAFREKRKPLYKGI